MSEKLDPYHAYRQWVTTPIVGRPAVSVVIPAYNEEWRILPTVGAIATHMSARGESWELIIADDGSKDSTVTLLSELKFANLRLLVGERNVGKGDAVRRGMLAATGEVVLFADADQSTPIEQFDDLKAKIDEGFDVVVGSRTAEGAQVSGKSAFRRFLSWGLHVVVATGFGITVSDSQCGFKLFTADAARTLFTAQQVDGFSFDLEILYLARRNRMSIAEVPVEWIDAPGSTVDAGRVSLQFLRDLFIIKSRDLRGGYGKRPRASTTGTAIAKESAQ